MNLRGSIVVPLVLFSSACVSTPTVNGFKAFADVGSRTQVAVAKVIDEAAISNVDADSQRMLTARRLALKSKPPSVDLGEAIIASNKAVLDQTDALRSFRQHSSALADYFTALGALAAFDGASGIGGAAQSTVKALAAIEPKIAEASIGNAEVAEFIDPAVTLAVGHFKAKALEQELQRNGTVIERQLDLQRAFLEALSEDMLSDYKAISAQVVLSEVDKPFASTDAQLGAAWVTSRRAALLDSKRRAEPVQEAAALSRKLHSAFIALVEKRWQADDMALYAGDLARLTALVELVAKEPAAGGR